MWACCGKDVAMWTFLLSAEYVRNKRVTEIPSQCSQVWIHFFLCYLVFPFLLTSGCSVKAASTLVVALAAIVREKKRLYYWLFIPFWVKNKTRNCDKLPCGKKCGFPGLKVHSQEKTHIWPFAAMCNMWRLTGVHTFMCWWSGQSWRADRLQQQSKTEDTRSCLLQRKKRGGIHFEGG